MAHRYPTDPISEALSDLPRLLPPEPRLQHLVEALRERGLGLLLAGASLPAIVPSGLPVGFIFGSLLVVLGLAMMSGGTVAALPAWLGRIPVHARVTGVIVRRGVPLLRRIERYSAVRLLALLHSGILRWVGATVVIMGVLIVLPIPFGNTIPGLSALFIGLGLVVRDGGAVALGLAIGVIALVASVILIAGTYEILSMLIA